MRTTVVTVGEDRAEREEDGERLGYTGRTPGWPWRGQRGSSNGRTTEGSVTDMDDDHAVTDTESLTWLTVLERRTAVEFVVRERT
jgi:hypothetical protein